MENETFVDGELESLLGMFNFNQCSSDESSFYNGPNETDVFSSDDFFPFGKILQRSYQSLSDGSNDQTNMYVDSRQVSSSQNVKFSMFLFFDELMIIVNTKQEVMKPRKKQKLSLESNMVTEPNTSWRDGQSLSSFNSSDDEKTLSKSLKGKAKRNKRIASDPQSLYARVIQETKQIFSLLIWVC